jgi:6-pyruvoyltetrahydropterin/6-carboxytetrahydropterin synthase
MMLHLTRRYQFAASHRLHSAQLGDEENQRVYGKCNNPYGHGHNYIIEVAVSGPIDSQTGMIANPGELDAFVDQEVIEPFDHKYLNEEIAEFQETVPTAENICMEIYKRVRAFPKAHLERIRLEETSLNSFEYTGEPVGSSQ